MLQKTARPKIAWTTDIPERGPMARCDRRMIRQALTNLLQNAADAVAMRAAARMAMRATIAVAVAESHGAGICSGHRQRYRPAGARIAPG